MSDIVQILSYSNPYLDVAGLTSLIRYKLSNNEHYLHEIIKELTNKRELCLEEGRQQNAMEIQIYIDQLSQVD